MEFLIVVVFLIVLVTSLYWLMFVAPIPICKAPPGTYWWREEDISPFDGEDLSRMHLRSKDNGEIYGQYFTDVYRGGVFRWLTSYEIVSGFKHRESLRNQS